VFAAIFIPPGMVPGGPESEVRRPASRRAMEVDGRSQVLRAYATDGAFAFRREQWTRKKTRVGNRRPFSVRHRGHSPVHGFTNAGSKMESCEPFDDERGWRRNTRNPSVRRRVAQPCPVNVLSNIYVAHGVSEQNRRKGCDRPVLSQHRTARSVGPTS
jgi:hypothetical protein